MSRLLTFSVASRLLVFAPHPDDETLATGELIQLAQKAGADVRVVFATDGDNNPWPQRWSERRLRIGAAERARWGRRRRAEALAALAKLGIAPACTRFLGWPDLGLTQKLMRDDEAIDALVTEIGSFAPTHVAMPSMRDRHPDHGALRVMIELAIGKARVPCLGLGYVVHGRSAMEDAWLLARDATRHERKREALTAHASQTALSRRRLMRWASQAESFEQAEPRSSFADAGSPSALTIPLAPPHRFWRRHDVLLVIADGTRIDRARVRVPRIVRAAAPRLLATDLCSGRVTIALDGEALRATFAEGSLAPGTVGYIKLERTEPRVLIFDRDTWHRFEDLACAPETAAPPRVEQVAVAQRASY